MKYLFAILALPTLFFQASGSWSKSQKNSIFPEGESCVAYRTEKTFAFVRTIEVLGKNCEITAQVIPEPDDRFHFELNIPISGFESGEAERDRDVAKLLKADISKELKYLSDSLKIEDWKQKIQSGKFTVTGKLTIGLKAYPINIEVSKSASASLFEGVAKTKFKDFEIDPPSLFAGIGAKVSDKLELVFQLNTDEVLGAQTLLKE